MGEAKAVGHWQGLRINALAAKDIDVFFGRTSVERRLQGREHFGALKGKTFLAREHDVAAIWQGTFRERLKVRRPIMMVCPVVRALKRRKSAER